MLDQSTRVVNYTRISSDQFSLTAEYGKFTSYSRSVNPTIKRHFSRYAHQHRRVGSSGRQQWTQKVISTTELPTGRMSMTVEFKKI